MDNLKKSLFLFIIVFYSFHSNMVFSSPNDIEEGLRPWKDTDNIEFTKWFTDNKSVLKIFIDNECPYKNISQECSDIIYSERIKYAEEKLISLISLDQSKRFGIFLKQYVLSYINLYSINTSKTETSNLEFKVNPLFLYDFDKVTRIFNLTPHRKNSHDEELEFNHFENGFRIQKYTSIHFGIGIKNDFFFSNASGFQNLISFTLGLVPAKEKTSLFNYYVDKKENISTSKRKLPVKSEMLEEWQIGDNVLFKSSGGAIFVASAGIPFLKIGTTIAVLGSWLYYLEKTGHNKVYINATRLKTKSAIAFTNSLTVNAIDNYLIDVGFGHSFEIDLSDFKAAKAYEDMLKGNLVPIQEMANDDKNLAVVNVEINEHRISGNVKSFIFDISLAKLISSKANYYSLSNTQFLRSGLKIDNEYGIYSREILGRTLTRHRNKIKSFYGGITNITDQENKLISTDNKIQFNWNFEKDHFDRESLDHAINDIVQDTGLDYLKIKTPDIKKLGYARITLRAEADSFFTKAIKGKNREFIFSNIQKNMFSMIEAYFNGDDKNQLCNITGIIYPCKTKYTQESIKALSKIKELSKLFKENKTKSSAQAYAEFGEQVWTNQFIFKAILEQMKSCGSNIFYEISGEKISDYKIENTTVRNIELCN